MVHCVWHREKGIHSGSDVSRVRHDTPFPGHTSIVRDRHIIFPRRKSGCHSLRSRKSSNAFTDTAASLPPPGWSRWPCRPRLRRGRRARRRFRRGLGTYSPAAEEPNGIPDAGRVVFFPKKTFLPHRESFLCLLKRPTSKTREAPTRTTQTTTHLYPNSSLFRQALRLENERLKNDLAAPPVYVPPPPTAPAAPRATPQPVSVPGPPPPAPAPAAPAGQPAAPSPPRPPPSAPARA